MTSAVWVVEPKLSNEQKKILTKELGDASHHYIKGAEDALSWYAAARTVSTRCSTSKIRQQHDRIAHAARKLAVAISELDASDRNVIQVYRLRKKRKSPMPEPNELLQFAVDVDVLRPTSIRGAPMNGARLSLVKHLARHFELATGRRATITENGPFARVLEPVLKAAGIPTSNFRPLIQRAIKSSGQ